VAFLVNPSEDYLRVRGLPVVTINVMFDDGNGMKMLLPSSSIDDEPQYCRLPRHIHGSPFHPMVYPPGGSNTRGGKPPCTPQHAIPPETVWSRSDRSRSAERTAVPLSLSQASTVTAPDKSLPQYGSLVVTSPREDMGPDWIEGVSYSRAPPPTGDTALSPLSSPTYAKYGALMSPRNPIKRIEKGEDNRFSMFQVGSCGDGDGTQSDSLQSLGNSNNNRSNLDSNTLNAMLIDRQREIDIEYKKLEIMHKQLDLDKSMVSQRLADFSTLGHAIQRKSHQLVLAANEVAAADKKRGGPQNAPSAASKIPSSPSLPKKSNRPPNPVGEAFEQPLDPKVVLVMQPFTAQLRELFALYSSKGLHDEDAVLDERGLHQLFVDFDVAPAFVSRSDVKMIVACVVTPLGPLSSGGLDERRFIEALARTALYTLRSLSCLYPTKEDKVLVLLELWGLGDEEKVREVSLRKREAKKRK
jgi:hypothetical protein